MSTCPVELKDMKAYLSAAETAEQYVKDQPDLAILASYCRRYAMEVGLKLRKNVTDANRLKECNEFLIPIMTQLESSKKTIGTLNDEDAYTICRDSAFDWFDRMSQEDLAGLTSPERAKATAIGFHKVGTFLGVLDLADFKKLEAHKAFESEVLEKRRYARVKSMLIMKAVKEGRTPEPGIPGQENGITTTTTTNSGSNGSSSNGTPSTPSIPVSPSSSAPLPTSLPAPPTAPPTAPIIPPSAPVTTIPATTPVQTIQGAPSSAATASTRPPSSLQHAPQLSSEINDSIELALFAVKALKSNDRKVGADRLRQALQRLGL